MGIGTYVSKDTLFAMAEEELPDWTTDMDEEILEILNTEMTLTPGIIAENIDRSSGAVTRRLNALEAGGLVTKIGRGKYRITDEALRMFDGGWTPTLSEEQKEEARREEIEQRKKIRRDLGISKDRYLSEAREEYERLKSQQEGDENELFSKAFEIVQERYQTPEDESS